MKNYNNMTNGGGDKLLQIFALATLIYCGDVFATAMEVDDLEQVPEEKIVYKSSDDTTQQTPNSKQIPWRKNKVFTHPRSDNRYTELQDSCTDNQLTIKDSYKLKHYKEFPNLQKLVILDNDLEYMKVSSPKFPELEEVEVEGMINEKNFSSLMNLLSKAPNLKTLCLKFAKITVDNLVDLMNSTENVKNYKIKELKLSGFIGRDEKKITLLTEFFIYVSGLESLDMSGIGLSILPASVETLTDLQNLNICGNKLMTSLPEEIGELRNLRTLNLSGTKLTKLPESIGNLVLLEELYLSSNMGDLPNSITNLKNLRIFDAAGCDNAKFWTVKLESLKSTNKNLEIILE